MSSFLAFPLDQLPFIFLALMIAFTLHEFAHAYTAYLFGDTTAKEAGRVTLNPMAHLDLLGTILIFIAGFGWARPVPVNRSYFKYPRLMGVIVSLAGPVSNLLIAFVWLGIFYALDVSGVMRSFSKGGVDALLVFTNHMVGLNILLFIFNLIPLPPLDGYRILEDLLPRRMMAKLRQIEQWAVFLFLIMVFIPPVSRVTIGPILSLRSDIFHAMRSFYAHLFG